MAKIVIILLAILAISSALTNDELLEHNLELDKTIKHYTDVIKSLEAYNKHLYKEMFECKLFSF